MSDHEKRRIARSNYFYDKLDAEWRAGMSDAANRKADAMTAKQRRALYEKGLKETEKFVRRGRKQGKWKLVPMYAVSVEREADAKITIVKGKPKIRITRATVTLGKLRRIKPRKRKSA